MGKQIRMCSPMLKLNIKSISLNFIISYLLFKSKSTETTFLIKYRKSQEARYFGEARLQK